MASPDSHSKVPQEAHVTVVECKTALSRKFARALFWFSLTVFILVATLYGLSFCFCFEYMWPAKGLATAPAPQIANQPATYFLLLSIDHGVLGRGFGYTIADELPRLHTRRSNLVIGSHALRSYLLPAAVNVPGLPLTGWRVPLWMFAVPFAVLSFWLRRWRRRPEQGHCESCGYNLRANTSGICPECGTPTRCSRAGPEC